LNDKRSAASVFEALREIVRFWRTLPTQLGARKMLVASALTLLSGLSEGLALLFLTPLIQSLDPAAGAIEGAMAWLPQLLQRFGMRLNLIGVLALFLGLVVGRSFLFRQSNLDLTNLRLNFLRDARVGLYSAIAHANWSFLRQRRAADLLSALTAETDRLDSAVYYALQLPGRAVIIAAHVAAACLIAPALAFAALGVGLLLAWLVRGRLAESLRLGELLSAAYQDYYHLVSEFFAGLKITKAFVAEDRHVSAFAAAIDEVKSNLVSFTRNQANARLAQEIAGACSVVIFLWGSVALFHMPVAEVLVLALIFYRLLPMVQALQQDAQQLLHMAPCAPPAQRRHPRHGLKRQSHPWRTGKELLEWPLRMHVLSSAVSVQSVWRPGKKRPTSRQRSQRRWLGGRAQAGRHPLRKPSLSHLFSRRRGFRQSLPLRLS
jgi:ABC-type multidrug transport system fused ATPase/permease subunit